MKQFSKKAITGPKIQKDLADFFFFPNPFFTGGRGKMPFLSAS